MATAPINYRKLDHDAAAITAAAEYALGVAGHYLEWLARVWRRPADSMRPLQGKRILEIGPGATLGTPALLACAGARVEVTDRFLAEWDPDFHPAFFTALLQRTAERGADYGEPLRRILRAGGFAPAMECHALAAEQITEIDGQFDAVLSNAVLEHVQDLHFSVASLAAKTAPGGVGFHQVDFRDHRDFNRPLEYLTLGEQEFDKLRRDCHCECGTRWRSFEVASALEVVGFDVHVEPNMFASEEYLADVQPRLHSEYADTPGAELRIISALFSATRAPRPASQRIEPEFFIEAAQGVLAIADRLSALAERFRLQDVRQANEGLARLTGELRQFAMLVDVLTGPLGIDQRQLTIDDQPPPQQLARFALHLQALMGAQMNDDWLGVADVLELDLEPILRAWAPRVLACARER